MHSSGEPSEKSRAVSRLCEEGQNSGRRGGPLTLILKKEYAQGPWQGS